MTSRSLAPSLARFLMPWMGVVALLGVAVVGWAVVIP
jgi:hypothetical protein